MELIFEYFMEKIILISQVRRSEREDGLKYLRKIKTISINKFYFLIIMTTLTLNGNIQCSAQYPDAKIRKPVFAGKFYPADSSELLSTVKSFFNHAVNKNNGKPLALIVPHAGYVFSGQTAADAYNQAKNYRYDLIVILGTNHTTANFNKISIYPREGYKTPLGLSKIDEKTADELIASDKDCVFNPAVHAKEHSIEVQLPFIQYLFPDTKILPAVVGSSDINLCTDFGKALAKVLRNKNALIVASSDLSHYPDYKDAEEVDHNTLETISKMDSEEFVKTINKQMNKGIKNLLTCACGEGPIISAMTAAKELGAYTGEIINYTNSGDNPMAGKDRVVGYGAVAFSKKVNKNEKVENPAKEKESEFELNDSQKKTLLSLARNSITQYLNTKKITENESSDPVLQKKLGAFVTLREHGELRGCIGYMREDIPLFKVVSTMALESAFSDMRFMPVILDELPDIEIEISVLTPAKPIKNIDEIVLGRDGVVLSKNGRKAVFLPQVATEMGWNKIEFLDNLCRKAGLPAGSWHDAELSTFQAKIFDESEFK
jgi:MEMO1 family protein